MQVLYVAEFDVTASDAAAAETDPAQACLEHLGAWIGGHTDPSVAAASLLEDGAVELSLAYGAQRRHASWEFVHGDDAWATRVERRDVNKDGSEFITRVTVGDSGAGVAVRVSMARESVAVGLTPAPPPPLRQPNLISDLAGDKNLTVRVDGQVQDSRFVPVRSSEEVEVLAGVLVKGNRLPVLLLHSRTLAAQANASTIALKLIGLVRVVTLDYRAGRMLQEHLPQLDVPYSGGLLVWADMSAPPADISATDVNCGDRDALRASLMSRIAPLSVLTRGADETYRRARQLSQAAQTRLAAQRTAEAATSGTTDEQLAAMQAELEQVKGESAYAFEEAQKADEIAEGLAAEVARLHAQVDQLKVAKAFRPDYELLAVEPETFDNAPKLEVGDLSSLENLSQHLERVAQGRIVFTPNVVTTWRKADRYTTPEEMRTGLIKLATVAHDIHDGQERSVGHFDTWVREQYDLRISMQDDDMPKKFRHFRWEGERYDRTPHVKINDGVPPDQCGRIYFTIDKANERIIVDHVGLHW